MLPIFDAHCDVLYRMEEDPSVNFQNSDELQINFKRLKSAGSKVQCFALFVFDNITDELKFYKVLKMVDIFYNQLIPNTPLLKPVRTKRDIDLLKPEEIGAMLTLEGCGPIGQDIIKLRTLFQLGVKGVGLTWNGSNAAADGALESRGAGLSDFGKQVVRENNRYKVWTDVSHLSVAGFWDVMEESTYPIASHSNARALCDHPRNLSDEQIIALAKKGGIMGMVFVPKFLNATGQATISDVLNHIDHVASLVGIEHIGFGSDFDGTDELPENLKTYSDYPILINELLKHYSQDQVEALLFKNFYQHLPE